ncbi:MAG: endonuclease/exonuclease/phosphatase family protein [Desulfobacter sp.]|nr:endonuclease/exonuclease/phosphatase family protein [Desulfobacter sp.]
MFNTGEKMSTDKRVTIMTLNLRFGLARDGENAWEKRQDRVAGILEQYPADFIGFQEVNHFQAGFLTGHLPDHNHIGWYNKKTPWWQSNMIFYHNSWTCLGSRHHFLTQPRECSEFCVTVSVPGSASAPAEVKVRSENGPSISHVGGVDFCWSGVPGTIFSICK